MIISTMKGVKLDIGAIMAQQEDTVAVGNANMNARGDLLGPGGKVVKKKEAISSEYHMASDKAVARSSLKDLELDVFMTPSEAVTKYTPKPVEAKQEVKEAPKQTSKKEASVEEKEKAKTK